MGPVPGAAQRRECPGEPQGAAGGLQCKRVGQMAEASYPNSPGSLQRATGAGLEAQSSDSHGATLGATDGNAAQVAI